MKTSVVCGRMHSGEWRMMTGVARAAVHHSEMYRRVERHAALQSL